MFRPLVRFLVIGLLLTLLISPQAKALSPCCNIVGIKGNVVTARNTATGKTFNFSVNDQAQLQSLKVGQAFTANQRDAWIRGSASSTTKATKATASPTPTSSPGAGKARSRKLAPHKPDKPED